MKKSLFTLVVCLMLVPCSAIAEDNHNGVKAGDAVIFNGGRPHRLVEDMPEGWYYHDTRMLTIEFPTTGFVPYTLSISSELNTLDYVVLFHITLVFCYNCGKF